MRAPIAAIQCVHLPAGQRAPKGDSEGLGTRMFAEALAQSCRGLLGAARRLGMLVVHTREGHRGDLTCLSRHKRDRLRRLGAGASCGVDVSQPCVLVMLAVHAKGRKPCLLQHTADPLTWRCTLCGGVRQAWASATPPKECVFSLGEILGMTLSLSWPRSPASRSSISQAWEPSMPLVRCTV